MDIKNKVSKKLKFNAKHNDDSAKMTEIDSDYSDPDNDLEDFEDIGLDDDYSVGDFVLLMSGDLCGVSRTTTCAAIHTITEIFAGKLREHINLPSTRAETAAAKQWFKRTGGFPGVVAAVGRTHIPILNPGGERSEAYRNRHDGAFSINVQCLSAKSLELLTPTNPIIPTLLPKIQKKERAPLSLDVGASPNVLVDSHL
uniref:Uncharacterized protein n=1 Tax=Timema tahoe TaxID=61484 RepID=A0A7R9NWC6_9NEOP|nr:unnamed protein product [Timema tahoe]